MKYTVIGGRGFIGSEIVKLLSATSYEVWVPQRNDERIFNDDLGIVVYAAGCGDCEKKAFDVLESNTILLSRILKESKFEKIIYISSTRLYMESGSSYEDSDLLVMNKDSRRLFNLTKLVSEELCRKSKREYIIVRPSNVYGLALKSPLFLPTIVRHAIEKGEVNMYISPDYAKDYVYVGDVANSILELSRLDKYEPVYNIGSGHNVKAFDIAKILIEETKCKVNWVWDSNTSDDTFPETNIELLEKTFKYKPRNILTDLRKMVIEFKRYLQ
ncbi:NAD-dependent epimerase/dehydratase family protein [Vibrio cyclitrophicus]|uniref:NAD-dependent epimerase/dehydratase family protein n=2 Tax=Vibrio cyclitrophicus TaxID=47951 RepID=UPI0003176E03